MSEKYIPSPNGRDCPQNGQHEGIECGCDECDHYMLCYKELCSDITEYEMREAQKFLKENSRQPKEKGTVKLMLAITLIVIVPIIAFILLRETCMPYFGAKFNYIAQH